MTTLVRFREPFRELAEMSRLVNSLFEGGNGRTNQAWIPAVDVWETEDALVYAFDLPGIPEEQISVEFEDSSLTVSAERNREHEVSEDRFYRYERRFGSFSRTIGLPQGTTEDAISADYKDGVLEVHVRKPEQAKPHRIQVGKASSKAVVEGSSTKQ
jgi:HSP20 family protein